jgi:hypothetical protein
MTTCRIPFIAGMAVLLLIFALQISQVLQLNQGVFTYTLDDPYIHLALAQNISHGHYGINTQDYSSPASSILWPIVLSPFAALPFYTLIPLLINMALSLAAYCVVVNILKNEAPNISNLRLTLTSLLLIIVFNTIGLTMNGMEHVLHMLCSLLILYGLINTEQNNATPTWLYAIIILNPLVRPEGMALSFLAIAYLTWRNRNFAVLSAGLAIVGLLAAYSYYLHSLGLDAVPSSVQVKSEAIKSGSAVGNKLDVILTNIIHPGGVVVLIGTVLMAIVAVRRQHPLWRISGIVALCGIAHILFGRMGWFARYEAYLNAMLYLMVTITYWRGLANLWNTRPWLQRPAFVFCAIILSFVYVQCTLVSPMAAHNIYQQHYQLYRFAQNYYPHNVAVNDIGYISLDNPHYVLDLYGLAYKKAYQARIQNTDARWMNQMVAEKNIKLTMLHDRWFKTVPENWIKLGRLTFDGIKLTPIDRNISFYATSAASVYELNQILEQYAKSLPPSTAFIFSTDDEAAGTDI